MRPVIDYHSVRIYGAMGKYKWSMFNWRNLRCMWHESTVYCWSEGQTNIVTRNYYVVGKVACCKTEKYTTTGTIVHSNSPAEMTVASMMWLAHDEPLLYALHRRLPLSTVRIAHGGGPLTARILWKACRLARNVFIYVKLLVNIPQTIRCYLYYTFSTVDPKWSMHIND